MKLNVPQKIYHKLFPLNFRLAFAHFRNPNGFGVLKKPEYNDDGLVTQHLPLFMEDSHFVNSYQAGEATGALEGLNFGIAWRAHVACWCASQAVKLEGDFVETGVGRGLLSKTIVTYLKFNSFRQKKMYLIDTFEGLQDEFLSSSEKDRGMVKEMSSIYLNNYQRVVETFKDYENVFVIKGAVPPVLHSLDKIEKVAYLSIDMNNALPEIASAEFFWPKLVKGGMILLDDFAYSRHFSDQTKAFQKFAKDKNIEILTLPTGQGLIIKN